MIIPLFDYGDTVWGDRNNQCLMKTLQVLHNKCAKLILNMKPYDSSTKVLELLDWQTLGFRRKYHRSATIYKSRENNISYKFNNKTGEDLHSIQTRNKGKYHLPKVKTNWGKQVSSYLFLNEWNELDLNIKAARNFNIFRKQF